MWRWLVIVLGLAYLALQIFTPGGDPYDGWDIFFSFLFGLYVGSAVYEGRYK